MTTQQPDHKPQTWPTAARARVAPVLRVIARVRRRRWLQTATARLLAWLAIAVALLAPAAVLARLDVLALPVERAAAVLAVVAVAHALWQRQRWRALAQQLDRQTASMDALATALWLAEAGRQDGWALVQAERAALLAAALQPRDLQPWRWPRALPLAMLAGGALAVAVFAPLDAAKRLAGLQPATPAQGVALALPGGPQPFTSAAALLGEDATRLLDADARLLGDIEAQVTDEPTRRWLGEVRQVVDGVADGRLDKRQALEQLAELDASKPEAPQNPLDAAEANAAPRAGTGDKPGGEAQSPEQAAQAQEQKDQAVKNAVAEAAKAAAKAAPKGAEKKLLEEAAQAKDLNMLAKLAGKLAAKDMTDKELEQWIKVAEKFAGALKDQKVPDKFKDLAARVDRLQKKRAQEGGLGASDQERLKSTRKELEQLRRENGDVLAAEHQVQRLERGAQQAADVLRRAQQEDRLGKKAKDSAEDKKQAQEEMKRAMRAAANELRRENERQQAGQAQRIGQNRMRELREALDRTGGKPDQARRQFDRKAGQKGENSGDDAGQQGGHGQKGQQESAEARDARRMAEARRKSGEDGEEGEGSGKGGNGGRRPGKLKLGQGKDGQFDRMEQIREGYEQGGGGRSNQPGAHKGDDREDANDKRIAGGKREQLKGQEGAGPDTKKVFSDAARKGFSRQGWRDIYKEYSQVADDMLDQEQIPPGRRSVVRQYFELIRPRKGWAPR